MTNMHNAAALAELRSLIEEYNPYNSDWRFRILSIRECLDRLALPVDDRESSPSAAARASVDATPRLPPSGAIGHSAGGDPSEAKQEPVAWCQPMDNGKPTPRKFMIYFDDPDHGIMVFDNEVDARAAFEQKNTAWNCYLFGALPARPSQAIVTLKTMKLSDGRSDYFVSIEIGDREVTPHVFREEYKAAYHVALYSWLLNGTEKPNLVAFGPDDWPAIPSQAIDRKSIIEECARWHDDRAKNTPDAFEMEFHKVCARAIRDSDKGLK